MAEMSIHTDYSKTFSSDSEKNLDAKAWISSPVFTEGQKLLRKRKQSVFSDNYINEQENVNEELMENNFRETFENLQQEKSQSRQETYPKEINHATQNFQKTIDSCDEEPDYAEPLDTVATHRNGEILPLTQLERLEFFRREFRKFK